MDLLISGRFVIFETTFLLLVLTAIGGTYVYDLWMWTATALGIITPRQILKRQQEKEQQRIQEDREKKLREIEARQAEESRKTEEELWSEDHTGDGEISITGENPATPISSEVGFSDPGSPAVSTPEAMSRETGESISVSGEESARERSPHTRKKKSDEKILESFSQESLVLPTERQKLTDLLALVKTRIARGDIAEARTLIIEGLSIDKKHREFNLLLGDLYEREGNWKKSEIIYRDTLDSHPGDEELMSKLSQNLIMLQQYREAYEIEKQIIAKHPSETHLFTVTGLAWELRDRAVAYDSACTYLRQYPRNPDIIWIRAQSAIELGQRKQAIEDLVKLKQLTPYNTEISELIQKLVMEEDMAKNFGE